jgi:hypothetical protein
MFLHVKNKNQIIPRNLYNIKLSKNNYIKLL